MIVPMLVVLLVPSAVAFHVATIQDAARSRHAARSITSTMAADANGDNDDKPAGPLLPPAELERLRSRIQKIQENGITSPSEKLFELATKETPSALMRSFFAGASPEVSQAMRDAITSLLGSLPPLEFDARMTTTGDKLAALMLQLQMTGYMLRNAEYVMTLRRLLQLKTRSAAEYREAFARLDLDGSGYIEVGEVEELLRQVYKGDVPSVEISSFIALFDTDSDGRVSWEEFAHALGATEGATAPSNFLALPAPPEGITAPQPTLTGTVTVSLDDGTEVKMDANAYMDQLKSEAEALRRDLRNMEQKKAQTEATFSTSIAAYVSSLSESQLKALTSGISEDVVGAMRLLVKYLLRDPSGEGELGKDQEVTMEQAKLQTLCLYQLVLGYKLREAEATGEANESIGR
jgi:hypothetical protein